MTLQAMTATRTNATIRHTESQSSLFLRTGLPVRPVLFGISVQSYQPAFLGLRPALRAQDLVDDFLVEHGGGSLILFTHGLLLSDQVGLNV